MVWTASVIYNLIFLFLIAIFFVWGGGLFNALHRPPLSPLTNKVAAPLTTETTTPTSVVSWPDR